MLNSQDEVFLTPYLPPPPTHTHKHTHHPTQPPQNLYSQQLSSLRLELSTSTSSYSSLQSSVSDAVERARAEERVAVARDWGARLKSLKESSAVLVSSLEVRLAAAAAAAEGPSTTSSPSPSGDALAAAAAAATADSEDKDQIKIGQLEAALGQATGEVQRLKDENDIYLSEINSRREQAEEEESGGEGANMAREEIITLKARLEEVQMDANRERMLGAQLGQTLEERERDLEQARRERTLADEEAASMQGKMREQQDEDRRADLESARRQLHEERQAAERQAAERHQLELQELVAKAAGDQSGLLSRQQGEQRAKFEAELLLLKVQFEGDTIAMQIDEAEKHESRLEARLAEVKGEYEQQLKAAGNLLEDATRQRTADQETLRTQSEVSTMARGELVTLRTLLQESSGLGQTVAELSSELERTKSAHEEFKRTVASEKSAESSNSEKTIADLEGELMTVRMQLQESSGLEQTVSELKSELERSRGAQAAESSDFRKTISDLEGELMTVRMQLQESSGLEQTVAELKSELERSKGALAELTKAAAAERAQAQQSQAQASSTVVQAKKASEDMRSQLKEQEFSFNILKDKYELLAREHDTSGMNGAAASSLRQLEEAKKLVNILTAKSQDAEKRTDEAGAHVKVMSNKLDDADQSNLALRAQLDQATIENAALARRLESARAQSAIKEVRQMRGDVTQLSDGPGGASEDIVNVSSLAAAGGGRRLGKTLDGVAADEAVNKLENAVKAASAVEEKFRSMFNSLRDIEQEKRAEEARSLDIDAKFEQLQASIVEKIASMQVAIEGQIIVAKSADDSWGERWTTSTHAKLEEIQGSLLQTLKDFSPPSTLAAIPSNGSRILEESETRALVQRYEMQLKSTEELNAVLLKNYQAEIEEQTKASASKHHLELNALRLDTEQASQRLNEELLSLREQLRIENESKCANMDDASRSRDEASTAIKAMREEILRETAERNVVVAANSQLHEVNTQLTSQLRELQSVKVIPEPQVDPQLPMFYPPPAPPPPPAKIVPLAEEAVAAPPPQYQSLAEATATRAAAAPPAPEPAPPVKESMPSTPDRKEAARKKFAEERKAMLERAKERQKKKEAEESSGGEGQDEKEAPREAKSSTKPAAIEAAPAGADAASSAAANPPSTPALAATTEWTEELCSHPLPPFGLDSPVISHLLGNWTSDAKKLQYLRLWLQCITDASKEVPDTFPSGLTLLALAPEIKDGFLTLVIPMLQGREGLAIKVYSRLNEAEAPKASDGFGRQGSQDVKHELYDLKLKIIRTPKATTAASPAAAAAAAKPPSPTVVPATPSYESFDTAAGAAADQSRKAPAPGGSLSKIQQRLNQLNGKP